MSRLCKANISSFSQTHIFSLKYEQGFNYFPTLVQLHIFKGKFQPEENFNISQIVIHLKKIYLWVKVTLIFIFFINNCTTFKATVNQFHHILQK